MKKILSMVYMKFFISVLLLLIISSTFSQPKSNNDQYNKLLSSSKKANIIHYKFAIGLGIGTTNNYVNQWKSILYLPTTPPETTISYDSTFQKCYYFQARINADIDFVDTRRLFLNVDGFFTFGFIFQDNSETDAGTGKTTFEPYEGNIKFGLGGNIFKAFILWGLGSYNFNHADYWNDPAGSGSDFDSAHVKVNYQKVGVGVRIGINKKILCDINFYKILPDATFYKFTSNPGVLKALTNFGTYAGIYPALPFGFSFSITKTNKFEVRLDYKKIRERVYIDQNASSLSLTLAKHFDFYNKRRK